MGPDKSRLSPDERSNLVAYLDGELSGPETEAIATKLTQSVSARVELEALKRSWDLLDHLPRAEASGTLANRTLSQAMTLVSHDDRFVRVFGNVSRRASRVLAWSGLLVAAFVLGLVLTRWAWPNPSARLARELRIAEHLDEYEAVGSFEFLQTLEKSSSF